MSAELFQRALELFRHGRLSEAKAACDAIVNVDSRHSDALHLLGLIAAQTSDYRRAVELLSRALAGDPDNAAILCNHGAALQMLHQPDAALASYDKAIKAQPEHANAHFNRGIVLRTLQRLDAAVASYDKAIGIRPDHAEAWFNRGIALRDLKQLEAAIASYDEAIVIRPDFAEAHNNRANALQDLKQFDTALASCDRAIAIRPDYAEAHNNRGNALQELKQFDAALASYDKAVAIKPGYAEAWYNRGKALRELQQIEAALASYDKAIGIEPSHLGAHINRGNVFRELKQLDAALASYGQAIAISPDDAKAHFSESLIHLLRGDFENGWPGYEWRSKVPEESRNLDQVQLSRHSTRGGLAGKHVALLAEQGIGDQIMFASLVRDATADAGKVVLECDSRLVSLYRRSFPGVAVFAAEDPPAADLLRSSDETMLVGSLGRLYRSAAADFPSPRRYLMTSDALADKWRERSAQVGNGLKVGIAWRGGTFNTGAELRSVALEQLAPLLGPDGVHWVSLQHGNVHDEIARHNASGAQPIWQFDEIHRDFDEMAALIEALDLVISVQTAVVHLCGAMSKPCWALIPFVPEWRYGLTGNRMRWYDSVVLFRQDTRGDWGGVIAAVGTALEARMRGAGTRGTKT